MRIPYRNEDEAETSACELTILMPCLNEAETLALCIETARRFLDQSGVNGEVLIADNGSSDGSQRIAEECGARVVDVPARGYGNALRYGIEAAHGRYVIMGDADGSYNFMELMPFVEQLRAGFDLVMGNRFAGGIEPGAMPKLHKYLGNPVLTMIGRLFFGGPSRDFHCGLRGFRRDAMLDLDLRTTGMEFASEMVVKATMHDLRVTEVPTTLSRDGRSRPPHLRSWRDGWRHLRFLLLYSPRWLFLYPGFAAVVVGLLMMISLTIGPVRVGRIGFDIHTLLLASLLVMVGTQSMFFAILAQEFAINDGLVPPEQRFNSFFARLPLEATLLIGLVLVAAGCIGILVAVVIWGSVDFGGLRVSAMMRMLVPSITAVAVGFQLMIASFFKGILSLKVVK
ncbi:MAG: glycosyltransferase family 2 protein [Chloroflexota bacterium]|nr:glycosyltransferase family 2 protein [Chloroflexota bacterium]